MVNEFGDSENAPESLFRMGVYYYRAKEYEECRNYFNRLYKRYSGNSLAGEGLYWNSWSYYREGNYSMAIGMFRTFIEKYPKNDFASDARMRIASLYYRQKNYSKSIDEYARIAKMYQGTAIGEKALYEKAVTHERVAKKQGSSAGRGDMMRALRLYRLLAKNASDKGVRGSAMFRLGQYYLDHKKEKLGISTLKKLAKMDKTARGARALVAVGLYYFEKGRTKKEYYSLAFQEFMGVVYLYKDLKDEVARASYYAAYSQHLRGNRISAVRLLDKLIQQYPGTRWAKKGRSLRGRI